MNKKVEYKILQTHEESWFTKKVDIFEMEQKLNQLGQEGWDIATSFDTHDGGGTKEVALILKRYI